MSRVYTRIRFFACTQIFCALIAVLLLANCSSYPWGTAANTGVVTNNPDSIPNIAWQTPGQRQMLVQQNNELANQVLMSAAAAPSLVRETAPEVVPASAPVRKVAVSLLVPLSGKKSNLGQSMLKAAQMALFDIGSANFEIVPRDTKGTPEGAAAAATDAVNAHADLILGPIFAEELRAVKPIATSAGLPVVSFTTDWTLGGDNTYIMGFLPFIQVARVAKYAQSRGYSKFAVYAPQTEYCDIVIRTLQSSGVPIVHVNRYSAMQEDLSILVQDFANTSKNTAHPEQFDFDALLLPVGSEGLRSLVSALDLAGIAQPHVRFLGTGLWDDVALTNTPALFSGWFAAPDPVLRADFERRFQESFGTPPLRLSSLAYDATALAAVLARSSQSTTESPYTRDALINPRGFAGIDGIFRFRSDGLSERGLAVLEIQSGRTVVVDRAPTAFIPPGN